MRQGLGDAWTAWKPTPVSRGRFTRLLQWVDGKIEGTPVGPLVDCLARLPIGQPRATDVGNHSLPIVLLVYKQAERDSPVWQFLGGTDQI